MALAGRIGYLEVTPFLLSGASWEGHVIEQIRRKVRDRFQYFYYRTHQGTECDLVLVRSGKVAASIEIKYSLAPVLNKGFHVAVDDLKSQKNFVIIPTGEPFQISTKKVASLPDF